MFKLQQRTAMVVRAFRPEKASLPDLINREQADLTFKLFT